MAYCMAALLLAASSAANAAETINVTIRSVERTALVYPGIDADESPAPVVVYFHGFKGDSARAADKVKIHEHWPEATVVYPQGLPKTIEATGVTAPGWQVLPGRNDDRDLDFVEALLRELDSRYPIDTKRTFAVGHSNGGQFTFALLATRPKLFAAFAPVSCTSRAHEDARVPRPLLYILGDKDQQFSLDRGRRTLERTLKLNRCSAPPTEWLPGYDQYVPGPGGAEVIWRVYDGDHAWPSEATRAVVKFFKEQQP